MEREYLSVKLGNSSSISNINVMVTQPGFYMDFHYHDFYHINRIVRGTLTVVIDGETYDVEAGCIVVLPPHKEHSLYSESGYAQIGVDVCPAGEDGGIYSQISEICGGFVIQKIADYVLTADRSVERMRGLLSNPSEVNIMRALNIAQSQVLDVLESCINDNTDSFFERFDTMVREHEPWKLKLSDMCRILCVSRTQLERNARYAFGCGAAEYCARLRYSKVCELLNTDMALSRIAEETGFCDSCHLSKFFSARAKMTPGEYRKAIK